VGRSRPAAAEAGTLAAPAGGAASAQPAESALKTLQDDAQWDRAQLSPEQQERLRQFLAARGEITAGDRFLLETLRGRARERQRYWLGVPLLLAGLTGGFALFWRNRPPRLSREARTAGRPPRSGSSDRGGASR